MENTNKKNYINHTSYNFKMYILGYCKKSNDFITITQLITKMINN